MYRLSQFRDSIISEIAKFPEIVSSLDVKNPQLMKFGENNRRTTERSQSVVDRYHHEGTAIDQIRIDSWSKATTSRLPATPVDVEEYWKAH